MSSASITSPRSTVPTTARAGDLSTALRGHSTAPRAKTTVTRTPTTSSGTRTRLPGGARVTALVERWPLEPGGPERGYGRSVGVEAMSAASSGTDGLYLAEIGSAHV